MFDLKKLQSKKLQAKGYKLIFLITAFLVLGFSLSNSVLAHLPHTGPIPAGQLIPDCGPAESGCTVAITLIGPASITGNNTFSVGTGATTLGGTLGVTGATTLGGTLSILEGGVTPAFYTTFQGGDQSENITYTLPATKPGIGTTTVLTNNGSGVLSWGVGGGSVTSVTGLLKGSGGTIVQAVAGTDYLSILSGDVVTSGNVATILNASTNSRGLLTSVDWNSFNNKVNTTRIISTGTGLSGGGDLSADRTIVLDINNIASLAGGIASDDTLAVYDASTTSIKKVSRDNFLSGITGALVYQGTWNASTNNPTLSAGSGAKGQYFVVSVAGTQNIGAGGASITFAVGDWVVRNNTDWEKLLNSVAVASVFNRTGSIVAASGDYIASQITNTPSGNLTSNNVQTALNELDSQKVSNNLTSGMIYVGSGGGIATGVSLSGDASLSNTGVLAIQPLKILNGMIANGTIDLTTKVTGTLPIGNGGTGGTDASTARTNLGLGTLATQNGTFSGTSSGTNTGDQTISDATITTTDITTNDVSITKHGFAPKLPGNTTTFLRGDGTYGVPSGTGIGDMVLGTIQTVTGAKTFNDGKLLIAGLTSGASTLKAPVVAGTNINTLPSSGGVLALLSDITGTNSGTNTGDVILAGQTYLTITGQVITANAVNLGGTNVTGTLPLANGGTNSTTAFGARTNLGLGNVDNTADTAKPVSIAQQTALDLKQNISEKDSSNGYAGLTLLKINFKNALNTITSFFTNTNTVARTYTFQDRDGTIADNTDLALKANTASPTFTGTVTLPSPFTLGATSVTTTGTELNLVAGVTSNIQTQINSKQSSLGFTPLNQASNLSDLANIVIARTNLGLGTLATQNGTFSGTSSGTNTGDQTTVTGNAGTATALQTARLINGVSFDGTANITVTAAAGTLTGTTLASGVTSSSLTSFGTSPTLITPIIGIASATSLTAAGAINSTVTGIQTAGVTRIDLSGNLASIGTISSGAITSSGALALGANSITSGLINSQTISSSANLTGTLAIAGATTLSSTLAVTGVTTLSSTLGVTGLITASGGITLPANQNLTLSSGTGTITQGYTNSATGSAYPLTVTNSNASITAANVKGLDLSLVGAVNTNSNANTITGINFGNVAALTNNTFNGLTFGTGLNNFLTSPTINITAAGAITGATGITSSGNASLATASLSGNLTMGTTQIAPSALAITYSLPTVAPTAGQVLSSTAGGVLSWAAGGGAQTPWTSNINAAGFTLFGNSTTSGNLTIDSTSSATKGSVFINPTGGSVGIGTDIGFGPATPGAKLEVVGDIISKGTSWTNRTASVANFWESVTYGNGLFVAVAGTGVGNQVMTSPDGIKWTTRNTPVANQWIAITYGNGLFVAVAASGAGNRVMTSPDGITWTIRNSAANNGWNSIIYGNGLFVAVSTDGGTNQVMTSSDGITWTLGVTPTPANNVWRSVTYGNGLFVAVSSSGTTTNVMSSSNGTTWTITATGSNTNNWKGVTYGNGLFVAVANTGSNNQVMTSSDGTNWTVQTSGSESWESVTYGNGLFVAVASSGGNDQIITSPDGITWTFRLTPSTGFTFRSIIYGNGSFVAVGDSAGAGNEVMTSGKSESYVLSHNNIYQGGMNIMGGNVGIGTTTPNQQLEITGNFRLPVSTATTGIIYSGTNTFIHNFGTSNFFAGVSSGNFSLTGTNNTGVGFNTLSSDGTGGNNSALGTQALLSNTIGVSNTAIGMQVLQANIGGNTNTGVGLQAAKNNTTGNDNTAIGGSALIFNTTGIQNTAIGSSALSSLIITNGTGNNTAVGYNTGSGIVTGINNTILGANVGGLAAGLSNNIIIADGSGNQRINVNSTGNVGIGDTTPASLLTVGNGDLFQVNSAGAIVAATGITSSGNASLATASLSGNLTMGTTQIAPSALAITYSLPTVAPTAGQVLSSTAGGVLSWAAGGGTPAGSSGQVQFNNAGAFAGASSLFYDNTNSRVGINTATPTEKLDVVGNISNLSGVGSLSWVGAADTGLNPTSVYVSGRYAYIVNNGGNTLQIYDTSRLSFNMSAVSTTATASGPKSIYVSGRYAYVVNNTANNLQVFDVSIPFSPVVVGTVSTGTAPISIFVSGRYAYVVNNTVNNLQVFDVSNPTSPVLSGTVSTGTAPISIFVSGRYAYVVNANSGSTVLQVFDISNPVVPSLSGSLTISTTANSVYVSGRYAYVLAGSDLRIYDISNPALPASVGSLTLTGTQSSIFVSGRYAYIVSSTANNIRVVDVKDPASPVSLASASTSVAGKSIFVSGRYAYTVTNGTTTAFQVYDISGIETTSAMIHSLEAGNLQVRNDIIAQGQLQVTGGISVGSGGLFSAGRLSVVGTGTSEVANFTNGSGSCNINPVNSTLSCSSDATLKHDINLFADTGTLDKVLALKPSTFVWNNDDTNTTRYGFIAQEVAQVLPNLVSTDGQGGKLSLSQIGMIPFIVKSIQEQQVLLNGKDGVLLDDSTTSASIISGIQSETVRNALDTISLRLADKTRILTDFVSARATAIRGYFDEIFVRTINVKKINAEEIVAEKVESKNGFTTYDTATNQPYCIRVTNGISMTLPGKCSDASPLAVQPTTGTSSSSAIAPQSVGVTSPVVAPQTGSVISTEPVNTTTTSSTTTLSTSTSSTSTLVVVPTPTNTSVVDPTTTQVIVPTTNAVQTQTITQVESVTQVQPVSSAPTPDPVTIITTP